MKSLTVKIDENMLKNVQAMARAGEISTSEFVRNCLKNAGGAGGGQQFDLLRVGLQGDIEATETRLTQQLDAIKKQLDLFETEA